MGLLEPLGAVGAAATENSVEVPQNKKLEATHFLFTYPPTDGHLGCLHLLMLVTNAAVKSLYSISLNLCFQ